MRAGEDREATRLKWWGGKEQSKYYFNSSLGRVGGDFVNADRLHPFGGEGVAFRHGHRGILQEHLRPFAPPPGEEVQEMVFAEGLGAGRGIGFRVAIQDAAVTVLHLNPRMVGLSMVVGSLDFQGLLPITRA